MQCICCEGNVNIVARLTGSAGNLDDYSAQQLQTIVSEYAYQKHGLLLETTQFWDVPWDVCFRCYVLSGAERHYSFSLLPQISD